MGFTVHGFDLRMTHTLSLYQALTGAIVEVDLPDGRRLHVGLADVVFPEYVKVVKGEGLRREGGARGDLIITFRIQFPVRLSPLQKELLDAALRMPANLDDPKNLQGQLLHTAVNLPPDLAEWERKKVRRRIDLNACLDGWMDASR
mmetsp:Transcript_14606/g.39814  ORF Transcript_14606/g.39814 Transcript_14606/m.39814 type:complete len:146 (+) Transcript_14606:186-623(+)